MTGILVLNSYGRYLARRRAIEGGLIALGILLFVLTVAGPISQLLQTLTPATEIVDFSSVTSLVAVVIGIAFLAGMAYGIVAISSQTQLQEDIPEEVRGRVFGVLNMLVSVASFIPIIAVGLIAGAVSTTSIILVVAVFVLLSGVASVIRRGPLQPAEEQATAQTIVEGRALDSIGVAIRTEEPARRRASAPKNGSNGG